MIYQGKSRHPVREVVLHCAGVPTGFFTGKGPQAVRDEIDGWHRARGWAGIGYHALILPSGYVKQGRPWDRVGAHVAGHNTGKFGLLLIESVEVERIGQFAEWFTSAQRLAARQLIGGLGGIEKVSGHNDYARKLCPGFKVRSEDWL